MATDRMPAVFVSHGAPTLAVDRERGRELAALARTLPAPRALLVVSAHWEATPVTVGTARALPVIHDFGGFPAELYELRYDAPPAPALAERVARMLAAGRRDDRGWDHGVWVPLLHMVPRADVPLVQLSLPSDLSARELHALGRRLAPLRDDGVLILGSGGLVHNLRRLDWSERRAPEPWALEFEAWARETLAAGDTEGLLDFRARAPALELAHPTLEHWLPLLVTAGAAEGDPVGFPIEGFEYGNLSRAAVRFG